MAEEKRALIDIQPIDILQEALPYQKEFILDPAYWKALCSERRGGKSFALALDLVNTCITTPRAKCVYLSLTNEQCKQVMWSDIFETVFLKYNINAQLNSKYEIKFPNGSIIYLRGIDATPFQMNRLRGQAFDCITIDEAQDFEQDLKELLLSVLKMASAQRQARVSCAGTPGNKQGLHYWWLINKEDSFETEWKHFKFHWKDNTKVDPKSGLRVCDAIQEMVDRDIERNPDIVNTPEFKQEILGQWVIETSARIYRYEPVVNDIFHITPAWLKEATYLLGFDLGFHPDPTSLVIGAYNLNQEDGDGCIVILKAEEHHKMITQDLAARIKLLDKDYKFAAIVGDSANLNIINDLNQTYGIATIKADKLGKLAHQNMLNSDFITGRIKLYKAECSVLSEQLQTVIWDKKALTLGEHKEDKRYNNHSSDALLYLHHYSRHQWYRAPKPKYVPPTNQQYADDMMKLLLKKNKKSSYMDRIDWDLPNE